MKQILRKKEFYFEAWQYTLIVYFQRETPIEEIAKKASKKNSELKELIKGDWNIDPAAMTLHPPKQSRSYMILNEGVTVGILSHETIHIVTDLFGKSNTEHNEHTDELYAYYSQHIFEKLVQYVLCTLKIPTKSFLNL